MEWLAQLLEWPVRVFAWLDMQLAVLAPAGGRLVVWSACAGATTMLLYGVLSPQRRIADAKRELVSAQRALDGFDGEFGDAWPLMRRTIGVALRQLGLVLGPAVAALLPMVLLVGWLAQTYGYDFPAQEQPVAVRTAPQQLPAHWIPGVAETRAPPRVALVTDDGELIGEIEVQAPVPVMEKRTWWAALAGSPPLAFLPDHLPVQRLEMDLPRREYLGWGPDWMRRWEFVFFVVLTIVALSVKRVFRIH